MVVGLGRIGWDYHIKAAAAHPGFKIVAGVDIVPERRKECEEVYHCPAFETIDEALKANLAELAVVATRSIDHCEHTVKALKGGCHVFVDKPAAMSLAEFDSMMDAARRRQAAADHKPVAARACRHALHSRDHRLGHPRQGLLGPPVRHRAVLPPQRLADGKAFRRRRLLQRRRAPYRPDTRASPTRRSTTSGATSSAQAHRPATPTTSLP